MLSARDIHVWTIPLMVSPDELNRLVGVLSDDERHRAARFLHRPSREQFTITRARLRQLLGRYLNAQPRHIEFRLSNTGKPMVSSVESHVSFNVSHTEGLAVVALASGVEVGVDIERIRPQPTHLDMATRYFTPAESRRLGDLPAEHSERAFFHVWTRKEAFLKATGLGLSHGLERFEVSVPPDPCRLIHIDGDAQAGAAWTLVNLEPCSGYVGALAIEGLGYQVSAWIWED